MNRKLEQANSSAADSLALAREMERKAGTVPKREAKLIKKQARLLRRQSAADSEQARLFAKQMKLARKQVFITLAYCFSFEEKSQL